MAEIHNGVLAIRRQREELHQRTFDVKICREELSRVSNSIRAEIEQRELSPSRVSPSPLPNLSRRQRRVLEGILAGEANKAIAYELGLSTKTVETHRARVMEKLHATSLAELVRLCAAPGVERRLLLGA
jgi:FixJ family two-component response regulator